MYVILQCWLHDHWVKEFCNEFDNRKLAMEWADNEVKEWLKVFANSFTPNCYDNFKSDLFVVYHNGLLWYRYVLKSVLSKDELELMAY